MTEQQSRGGDKRYGAGRGMSDEKVWNGMRGLLRVNQKDIASKIEQYTLEYGTRSLSWVPDQTWNYTFRHRP